MVFTVGVASLTIFFFALMMISASLLYRKRMELKYSVRNMFPFEFTYKTTLKTNFYSFLFIMLFVMSTIGFFITFDMSFTNGFNIYIMISGILTAITIMALFIVPLNNLRIHIIFAAIFFTLNFTCCGANVVNAWKINQSEVGPIPIVVIVIGIILVLSQFVLMLNPRLNLDFKAVEKVNEKGEKYYERPKWVVFAFTEWMNIIFLIINIINITILKAVS